MIGGIVHTVFTFGDRLSILVRGTDCEKDDFAAVDVPPDAPKMAYGDGIWWQGDIILWSPKNGAAKDVHVPRIGYSYAADFLWRKVSTRCRAGICPECANPETMHDGEGRLWCDKCDASYDMSQMPTEGELLP